MFIIGHRGAAGLAPENTIASIEAAAKAGVDMIEFDVRATRDGKLVIFHDDNLKRLTGESGDIKDLTIDDINITATHSGHPIPTLLEGLEAAGDVPVLLDLKGENWTKLLIRELKKHHGPTPSVSSGDLEDLKSLAKLAPGIKTYLSELTNPFGAIHTARTFELTGISLNYWVLNPLAYRYAKSVNCKILVYPVNHLFFARFLHFLYPQIGLITNVPHKLAKLSRRTKGEI
jgi:glycerophosphoryl diester phosphodiesterase